MTLFEPEVLFCEDCMESIFHTEAQLFYEAVCIYYASTGRCFELGDESDCEVRSLEKLGAISSREYSKDTVLIKPNGHQKISEEMHKFCFNKH